MAVNEAPEKIYVHVKKGRILNTWNSEWIGVNDIEYTRTDAFIEKACEYWYQYNRDIVKKHGAKAVLGCSEFTVNVEGFKKYMDGE
jgi:hypothetical protein